MKGLLVKDFRLLLQRGKFFIILGLITIFMAFTLDDSAFIVGWITMITAIFSLSTLSYDEYDNCMPFLMSLPVTSREYALEKYFFSVLCALAGWIFSIAVMLPALFILGKAASLGEELSGALIFIPLILILLAVCIPIELKWGSEKGRTYLLVVYGIIFAAVGIGGRFLPKISASPAELFSRISYTGFLLLLCAAAVVIFILSAGLSIRIVEKKEY